MGDNERKTKKYFAPRIDGYSFSIPVLDKNGTRVPVLTANGQQRYIKNQPQWMEKMLRFTPLPVDQKRLKKDKDPVESRGSYFELQADNPEYDQIFKTLEGRVADPQSAVIAQEEYERQQNPAAYAERAERLQMLAEKELMETQVADAEFATIQAREQAVYAEAALKGLAEEKGVLQSELERMQAQMADLKAQVERRGPGRPPKPKVEEGTEPSKG